MSDENLVSLNPGEECSKAPLPTGGPSSGPILNVSVRWPRRDVAVVSVRGEIDTAIAPRLREVLMNRVRSCLNVVIIDLSGVAFIDSAGVELLAQGHNQAAARDILLRVVAPVGSPAEQLFLLTGMKSQFVCFNEVNEAIWAPGSTRATRSRP